MRAALALAARGLGQAAPNPSVGCVIVSADGHVVGRATTAPGGRPHAETQALAMAGAAACGGTAYVTLEPCSHHGQTRPCAEALADAGVARVVIGAQDPDPRVDGRGIALLRARGVLVETGVLAAEANELLAGFAMRVKHGRPLVTLKLATTLDGRIATRTGQSQWITGPEARRAAHALRGTHDAVLVGAGTVAADDPDLTCRIDGFRATPDVRVIADSHLRTRLTARVVATASVTPTWFLCRADSDPARRAAMREAGATLIDVPGSETGIDISAALAALGAAGLTRVLCEGGCQLAASLLRAGVVDRLAWFHAPAVMGGDGLPAAAAFGVSVLEPAPRPPPEMGGGAAPPSPLPIREGLGEGAGAITMPRFTRRETRTLGPDMLSLFDRAPGAS